MKKRNFLMAIALFIGMSSFAQTQKGYYIIGAQLASMDLNFQSGNTSFGLDLHPQVAWFVKDNLAIGGQVELGVQTSKGYTAFNYGIGALGRYYVADKATQITSKSRFFLEANAGITGQNYKSGGISTNTNGLGIGFGPGLAYFINQNIALEGLVKYNLGVGFGNSTTTNNIHFNLGFSIHLPGSKLKELKK
ncbi:MAG: outer membrane beta-barrel protein [Bacteroidetes bacterium]|nr:outer membrane beta-barrel protein [Bacteroidota bacterium]